MQRIPKWLRDEWERVVFGAAAAMLVLAVVWRLGQAGAGDAYPGGAPAAPEDESLLAETALALLESQPSGALGGSRDPFLWRHPAPEAKPPGGGGRKPPAPPPVARPAPPAPGLPAETVSPAEAAAPVEAPRPAMVPGSLRFTYQGKDRTGRAVAILSVRRRGQTGMPATVTLGIGDEAEGVRVMGISENAILVRDARGRRLRVGLQEETAVWLQGK